MLSNSANELAEEFLELDLQNRLQLLLEFANSLPELPERYADHPDLFERVEECQSPVYLFTEIQDGRVRIFLTAPREAPTTRGFASILHSLLDGQLVGDVLSFDDDFPNRLGLREAISALRLRGMAGMLARIKRQTREKSSL
jgi:cysteine desulfuration protein SufE